MPEELKTIPALAIECCIYGDISQATDEIHNQFYADLEDNSFIIHVKALEGEK